MVAEQTRIEFEQELSRLAAERDEALAREAALAEICQLANAAPGNLEQVFIGLLGRALRLCKAQSGIVFRYDGAAMRLAAFRGAALDEAAIEWFRVWGPEPDSAMAQILRGAPIVHIKDARDTETLRSAAPSRVKMIDAIGARTTLWVALRRADRLLGVLVICRRKVRPFAENEIALLRNFADQAAIAIENARLLGELRERTDDLRESLEYQTATSDVLNVISRSTFDLQPVLQTVVDAAIRLCRADQAVIFRDAAGTYQWAASRGNSPEYEEIERGLGFRPGPESLVGRTALEARPVHINDAQADPLYGFKADAQVGGIRTLLGVPLMRQGRVIGVIGLARRRVEPFTERQIELVRTFADQAVIAIENTRLINETREALEQQTATAEVLGVINASPGDLQPVFDVMLDKAMTLCGAPFGGLLVPDGEFARYVALRNTPERWAEFLIRTPPRLTTMLGAEFLRDPASFQIADLAATDGYRRRVSLATAAVELGGIHSVLFAPLLKEGLLVGVFTIYRTEVRPFSDKQIALVENFAAQAVIAMDNARLLEEIRQRQAELRVTFDNMGDGVAMFDAGHRLAAWNRNFQQILDLPEEFVEQRPTIEQYIRYLAERGEYGSVDEGEVRRLMGRVAMQWSVERARPDGRVVELRNNPVPGGGFVLIYGDITERKHAEAEIRTARDAAERALGELKAAQASLIHAEKMASLGQLTAGIAHEIKNPLNFVNNFATLSNELLGEVKEMAAPAFATLDADTRADLDETMAMLSGNLDKITEHGRRADGIVKSMLAHSRGTSGERQKSDINALVEEALNLAYHGARAQDQEFNISLERDFAPGVATIELVPQDVTRVFLNLIGNGFHAAHKRRKETADPGFRPLLTVATRDLGDAVEVRVRDNGTGIRPEHRDRLFQPFFTTKSTGEGTGLGLSISYDIVTQQHGGTITVDSELGSFTEFIVRLPRPQ